MRLLLDTHVFLWYITNDRRLSPDVCACHHRRCERRLLECRVRVGDARQQHGIVGLALEIAAATRLLELPAHHRDPFDRMLVCQAIHHDLTLVTSDAQISKYAIRILRAG